MKYWKSISKIYGLLFDINLKSISKLIEISKEIFKQKKNDKINQLIINLITF